MNRPLGIFALAVCLGSTNTVPAKGPIAFGDPNGVAYSLAFSPDGKYLVNPGQDGTLRLWEIATKKVVRQLRGAQISYWSVAFTPDGKRLAATCADFSVRVWDVATGKEVYQLKGHTSTVWCVAVSPDGKILVSGSEDQTIRLWSLATGKGVLQIGNQPAGVWPLAFAPDGKTLAVGYSDGGMILWDAATGKKARLLPGHAKGVWPLVFSPDGRTIASCGWGDPTVILSDAVTGKIRRKIQVPAGTGWSLAFSPDGRTLLSGGGDAVVHCWEVATGQERARFQGHKNQGGIYAVAFAASGRMAASADWKGEILVWDVPDLSAKATAAEMKNLWNDLRSADAAKAYRAVWTLREAPDLTIPFFRKNLRPRPMVQPDPKLISRLIADLDHEKFIVRRNATIALEKLGQYAETALRQALGKSPSPETRMRIEMLLSKLEALELTPDRLQANRALEVLENLGTPEARKLFEELVRQDKDPWLQQEAKAALERLARKVQKATG